MLTCLDITESMTLECIETTADGSKTTLGSATREKGGDFVLTLRATKDFVFRRLTFTMRINIGYTKKSKLVAKQTSY